MTTATELVQPREASRPSLRRLREYTRDLELVPVVLVVFVVSAIINDTFLTQSNLINVLSQSAVLGLVVIAEALILIVGRIDLSVESVVTLAPLAGAWLLVAEANGGGGIGLNPWLAILAVLAIGLVVGLVNGFLVVKIGLNTFVVTLAMLILLRGLADGLAKGKTIFGLPEEFTYLGSGEILGLPVPVWVAAVAYAAAALFLKHHRIGRSMYAIGGNEEAARAAGINVNRIVIGCFVGAGVLSAIAGLMLTGRLASATSQQGENLVFSVLAAVVIGGISLNGGRGRMIGALSGVLLLGMVQNILILSNIESYWIEASYGLIILIALLLTRAAGRSGD